MNVSTTLLQAESVVGKELAVDCCVLVGVAAADEVTERVGRLLIVNMNKSFARSPFV